MSAPRNVRTLPAIASLACVLLAHAAGAQSPPTSYPQTVYPQGPDPQATYPQSNDPQGGKPPSPLRQVFANTLTAMLQGASGGIAVAVTQGITGGINTWFERKQRKALGNQPGYAAQPPAPTYPVATGYPSTTPAYDPNNPYSATAQASSYPSPQYGASQAYPAATPTYTPDTSSGAYSYPAQSSSYDWSNTQVYDPRTGQATSASSSGYALASPPADASLIAAGGAYDVYAMRADGSETPVNAATYDFRTGDRFKVYFRPSLPGRLDVYNINPNGRESKIDGTETAAGQLTTLGPYEFTATKGNEALRFVLSPCSNPQLMVATRDIVNVGPNADYPYATGAASAYPTAQPAGISLTNCSNVATRGIRKRDITKVAMDGTTSYALDPVSQTELASGQLMAREFTIYFRHN